MNYMSFGMDMSHELYICFTNHEKMAKVIGVGGVFFKYQDPQKIREWYKKALGVDTNDYGILFGFNGFPASKGYLQVGTFESNSDYFGTKNQHAMINFRVDNLEALMIHLKSMNTVFCNEMEEFPYGKFLHIEDPEGNRLELWQPEDEAFDGEIQNEMR
jgi:predicted enzyme related to lactoylglutathione lyase